MSSHWCCMFKVGMVILYIMYTPNIPIATSQSTCQDNNYPCQGDDDSWWYSTDDIKPTDSTIYGQLKLRDSMYMAFDIVNWVTGANQLENIFRIGFSANISDQCDGKGSRYPALYKGPNDNYFHFAVSEATNCYAEPTNSQSYYQTMRTGSRFSVIINYNESRVTVQMRYGSYPMWTHIDTSRSGTNPSYFGSIVSIFIGTDHVSGHSPEGIADVTLSNMFIVSYWQNDSHSFLPTSAPTAPTVAPTEASISCGETVSGSTSNAVNNTHYYNINLPVTMDTLIISSCNSDFDTWLYWQDSNGNDIFDCDDCGSCEFDIHSILTLTNVSSGNYRIGIGGYSYFRGDYQLSITCDYAPKKTPTMEPSVSPSFAPTTPPTDAPTPICPNLKIDVMETNPSFDKMAFEGLYVYQHGQASNGRPVWRVPQTHKLIDYANGTWIISAEGSQTLSYNTTAFYPPYNQQTSGWKHSTQNNETYHVSIGCVESFAPIAAPTNAPTLPPTSYPTFTPSISPSLSPSAAPSDSPTWQPSLSPSFAPVCLYMIDLRNETCSSSYTLH